MIDTIFGGGNDVHFDGDVVCDSCQCGYGTYLGKVPTRSFGYRRQMATHSRYCAYDM